MKVLEAVSKDVAALAPGEQFTVNTNAERKHALTAARVLGKRIITRRRRDKRGFTIAELAQ